MRVLDSTRLALANAVRAVRDIQNWLQNCIAGLIGSMSGAELLRSGRLHELSAGVIKGGSTSHACSWTETPPSTKAPSANEKALPSDRLPRPNPAMPLRLHHPSSCHSPSEVSSEEDPLVVVESCLVCPDSECDLPCSPDL